MKISYISFRPGRPGGKATKNRVWGIVDGEMHIISSPSMYVRAPGILTFWLEEGGNVWCQRFVAVGNISAKLIVKKETYGYVSTSVDLIDPQMMEKINKELMWQTLKTK